MTEASPATQNRLSPLWCAIGSVFLTPITALLFVLMGVAVLLAWPFIPFLCYAQWRDELRKAEQISQTTNIRP